LSGTVVALPSGGTISITRSHDDLILLGPISTTLSDTDCVATVANGWAAGEVEITIVNNGSYDATVDYDIVRYGRKQVYL